MSGALQRALFDKVYPVAPRTEGIKYAGSKLKLLPQILWLVDKTESKSVFDGFSGSTRVSQALARSGYQVLANDRAVWSEVFNTCYLLGKAPLEYRNLIQHLNDLPPKDGWFSKHYGGENSQSSDGETQKMPWQIHNTRRLDAIRDEIDALNLDDVTKAVALTSLVQALDTVDSTLGHFVSYLREWSPRSFKKMKLDIPNIVQSKEQHSVVRKDIFDIAPFVEADLAYYDPPYGSNNEKMPPSRVRYSSYYHLWTTVCLNDKPELFGKVNRRSDTRDAFDPSVFEEFRRGPDGNFLAVEAIHRLLKITPTKHIILSYSSGGRATAKELDEAIEDIGSIERIVEIDFRRNVMAGMTWTNEWLRDAAEPNREFLFLIKRR